MIVHARTYMRVLTRTTLGIFKPFRKHFTSGIPILSGQVLLVIDDMQCKPIQYNTIQYNTIQSNLI